MRLSFVHRLPVLMRIDGDFIFLLVQLVLAGSLVLRGFTRYFKNLLASLHGFLLPLLSSCFLHTHSCAIECFELFRTCRVFQFLLKSCFYAFSTVYNYILHDTFFSAALYSAVLYCLHLGVWWPLSSST